MLVNHFTEDVLHKKTVAKLRDIIKEKGLKATPKMRKADLIALILGEDESSVFNDATKKLAERIQKNGGENGGAGTCFMERGDGYLFHE